jgi:hypothetical protein
MAVSVGLHNTADPSIEPEVRALVEHRLSARPGEGRVSIVGSRENDDWDLKGLGTEMGLRGPTHWWEVRGSTSV